MIWILIIVQFKFGTTYINSFISILLYFVRRYGHLHPGVIKGTTYHEDYAATHSPREHIYHVLMDPYCVGLMNKVIYTLTNNS